MIIGGVNISTYGLQVLRVNDFWNQTARKKILDEPAFTGNDIKFKAGELQVILFGSYATAAEMETGLNNLKTKIQSSILHEIEILDYNIQGSVSFKKGAQIKTIRNNAIVEMNIEMPFGPLIIS